MSATKILWGQVITVFLIVLAAVWAATQWTAAALAYQPENGGAKLDHGGGGEVLLRAA
ncbi:hypothetical protein [Sphingobium sp. CFD-2]|uniref:hypothetical protein n=1 Tax=Sphingobium sp. CFD-2 TaxID=2878542 RepID=UPI00214BF624|nr:hypothetical protein [Sphingobium sp. CFD-2]